jgi:hypothetical protein
MCALRTRIIDNLRALPFAPGVQMQQVPGMSLGKAIGVTTTTAADDYDVDDQLDAKIRGESSHVRVMRSFAHVPAEIQKAKMTGDATSDEDEDMESDGDSGPVPVYPRLGSRAKRQGGGGMAASKGKTPAIPPAARGAVGKGKGKAAASIMQGYSSNFDSDARIAASNAGRKKRTFFSAAGLPPLLPLGGISPASMNGASMGKASVAAHLKQAGAKPGSGGKNGDGKRSRRGSPMSVA